MTEGKVKQKKKIKGQCITMTEKGKKVTGKNQWKTKTGNKN